MALNDKNLGQVLLILREIRPIIDAFDAARQDGKISFEEGFDLFMKLMSVMEKHNFTPQEFKELIIELVPIIRLLTRK